MQDAIVIGMLMLVATFAFGDKFLTTSAVSAVVLGFALQDTLGNAFAGLAIQSEKPFNIGHWITVGDHEGRVAEVTWRATKLRTKTGNFVIVPEQRSRQGPDHQLLGAGGADASLRRRGRDLRRAAEQVKAVDQGRRSQNCPLVLKAPAPDAMIHDFAGSAIIYRVRFWIEDFEIDEEAADQVRARALLRVPGARASRSRTRSRSRYSKEPPQVDEAASAGRTASGCWRRSDLFASLTDAERATIAARMSPGRVRRRRDDRRAKGIPASRCTWSKSGAVEVVLEASRREIATIEPRRLLRRDVAADRRAADRERRRVRRRDRARDRRRRCSASLPRPARRAVEQVGVAAATRRAELAAARATATNAAAIEPPANFLARMRKFLSI